MEEHEAERLNWANEQMVKAEVPDANRGLIEKLLQYYWEHPTTAKLSAEDALKTLGTFAELAQGHVLVPDDPEGNWVPAKPGTLVLRDQVRVRADAYAGDAGLAHNGRIGTVTAMRYGDIHVRYTDGKEPSFKDVPSIRHSPHKLDKLIR